MLATVDQSTFLTRLQQFEDHLWGPGFAALRIGNQPPRLDRLADRVAQLSDLYTLDRAALDSADDRFHLLAKVFYFLCSDAPKAWLALSELTRRHPFPVPSDRPLAIIDAGAGAGATSVGLLLALAPLPPAARIVLTALDADPAALRVWSLLVAHAAQLAGHHVTPVAHTADLRKLDAARIPLRHDLLITQSLLNELFPGESPDAVAARAAWLKPLAARGPLLAIEPALRETTRPLHAARDLLLADPAARLRALAPCPHQAPCPILTNQRDWCHESRPLPPTRQVAAVQALTRRRDDRVKWSFLALAPAPGVAPGTTPTPETTTTPPATPDLARIVSDPLNSKGKLERHVCRADGRLIRLRLLDRDRSPQNLLLADAPKGQLITITPWPENARLAPASQVAPRT